ncbi:MAG: diguanylate cyclase [Selenomonadaceae bacterium]|nr:diguanylate cyclase [Selenomonadaceae bacterium]
MSKILVVDDEEMMLMMARHILSRKYEIITASDGFEAIELFEAERPDMVLSDLMMPEMDGYELHRILQEKSAGTVPIMFMTADESIESESKGFEVGAADYIRKPLRPDILLKRVGVIMDNLDKIRGLQAEASTDQLTKLLNKSSAQKEIGEAVKKSAGALLMLDLDSFKLINDIYGHIAGDKILIRFAELIKSIIRENDLAGRMGGDEFVVFLRDIDDEKVLKNKANFLNENLLETARKMFGEDMDIPLGTSIGAVFVPEEGKDFSTLYEKADKALYEVKQHGKHGIFVFGAKKRSDNNLASVEGISQMRMILGERNIEPGAYVVEFEDFKKIYRLMVRLSENYKRKLILMQFTLLDESFAEEFKETLIHSLRKSDCVTCSGKKFLVLLPEAALIEAELVKNRIFSRLDKGMAMKIVFEPEKIF